jgi:hypothetical protein
MKKKLGAKNAKGTEASSTPAEESVQESKTLTPEEVETMKADSDSIKAEESVSTEKMDKAISLIENYFNLSGKKFTVRSVTDKGDTYKLTMDNEDFEMTVTINSLFKHGITDAN